MKDKIRALISNEQYDYISKYCAFLLKINVTTNLLSSRMDEDGLWAHIYTSIFLAQVLQDNIFNSIPSYEINKDEYIFIDIGSGNGMPGIILKIMMPFINLCLLDSNIKKCSFLLYTAAELKLKLKILHKRIEDLNNRDICAELKLDNLVDSLRTIQKNIIWIAKGFASLKSIFNKIQKLYQVNHWKDKQEKITLILLKGQNFEDEIAEASDTFAFSYLVIHNDIISNSVVIIFTLDNTAIENIN